MKSLTKKQYDRLYPYIDVMKAIIVNSSASNLSPGYKITLTEVGDELGIKLSCTCSSGWFRLTTSIYTKVLDYQANQKTNEYETKADRRSSKNSKRKS